MTPLHSSFFYFFFYFFFTFSNYIFEIHYFWQALTQLDEEKELVESVFTNAMDCLSGGWLMGRSQMGGCGHYNPQIAPYSPS